MIRFINKPHAIHPDTTLVEIWDDVRFLGAIYCGSGSDPRAPAIRILSRHLYISGSSGPDPEGITTVALLFNQDQPGEHQDGCPHSPLGT